MLRTLCISICACIAGGCIERTFDSRAFLANRTDRDLLVDIRSLEGNCAVLWEHGAGVIREDDFDPDSIKVRLPPNSVAVLPGCAARIAINGVREDVTWDPALPRREIRRPRTSSMISRSWSPSSRPAMG